MSIYKGVIVHFDVCLEDGLCGLISSCPSNFCLDKCKKELGDCVEVRKPESHDNEQMLLISRDSRVREWKKEKFTA